MNKDLRIGLIEPYATQDGALWGPRMKDLYSMVRLPSRAVDLLAAILTRQDFSSVTTYNPLYNRYGGEVSSGRAERAGRNGRGRDFFDHADPAARL